MFIISKLMGTSCMLAMCILLMHSFMWWIFCISWISFEIQGLKCFEFGTHPQPVWLCDRRMLCFAYSKKVYTTQPTLANVRAHQSTQMSLIEFELIPIWRMGQVMHNTWIHTRKHNQLCDVNSVNIYLIRSLPQLLLLPLWLRPIKVGP